MNLVRSALNALAQPFVAVGGLLQGTAGQADAAGDAPAASTPPDTKADSNVSTQGSSGPAKLPVVAAAEQSVDNMRATAKWIITILSALAAVLIAGTQLTSFGKLPAPDALHDARLWIAWVSGILTLIAIGAIIWKAIQVLTVGNATIADLVKEEKNHSKSKNLEYAYKVDVLDSGETVREFNRKWTDYRRAEDEAESELFAARLAAIMNPEDGQQARLVKVAEMTAAEVKERHRDLGRRRYILLSALRADIVGRTMSDAVPPMLYAGVIGGISLGAFVWAVNPPPEAPPAFLIPAEAIVELSPDEQQQYDSALGEKCVTQEFDGLVLEVDDDQARLVSIPSDVCEVAEIDVAITSIRPAEHIPLPSPATPSATPRPSPSPQTTTMTPQD